MCPLSTGFPPVVAIVGPTAVGKSRLAMELASRLDADIISFDSRQVYRYMDVGTAKPSAADRARIRHYMIDVVAPSDTYSAQRYATEAGRVLQRLSDQGRVALLVGGTGFYLEALLSRATLPAVPPRLDVRARLRSEASVFGNEALHRRLASIDPPSARRIHPNNLTRLIRALEIVETLGGPVPQREPSPRIAALRVGVTMERQALHAVADRRVDEQLRSGLLEEAQLLLTMGFDTSSPALQGFGYRQMLEHLTGRSELSEAVSSYKRSTRAYIRRQMTWFRRERDTVWLEASGGLTDRAYELIRAWLSSGDVTTGSNTEAP